MNYTSGSFLTIMSIFITNVGCNGLAAPPAPRLHAVVQSGEMGQLKKLFAQGANADVRDHKGDNALSLALGNGRSDMAELLLSNGAKMNYFTKYGNRGLVWSCLYKDRPEVLDWACRHGLKLSEDALVVCLRTQRFKCAEWLLKNHVEEIYKLGQQGLVEAARGNPKMLKLLSTIPSARIAPSSFAQGAYGLTLPPYRP